MSGLPAPTVIYAFGDSLSDAGDASLFSQTSYAASLGYSPFPVSPPYADESYPAIGGGSVTAGVFSNGPIWVQDLATTLGITAPAPGQVGINANTLLAALTPKIGSLSASFVISQIESAEHTVGVNPYLTLAPGAAGGTDFAIGGSVTGPTGFNTDPVGNLSDLAAQLASFHAEVPAPAATALYTVWSGSNDLLNLVESSNFATLSGSGAAATDVAQSVANEVAMVQGLVGGGAKSLMVLNVPDIGLAPEITQRGTAAAAAATALAQSFDTQLASALATTNFGTATVKLVDTFGLIDNAVANPGSYGLSNVSASVYTGSFASFTPGDLVSNDPAVQNTYLFFDGLHPTSTVQMAVAAVAQGLIACFAAGTRVATAEGLVAVERLRVGDRVVSVFGGTAPVVWLGHRRVECRRYPRPHDLWPVRVRRDAFAPGQPARDLLLSPDHAVYVDGVLVPVRYLMNGATIVQEQVDAVTYWHVELAAHDVLLAEGLPAESYLDTGNRGAFVEAAGAVQMVPEFSRGVWEAEGCAPLVTEGPRVLAIRARLRARADVLGARLTTEAGVVLVVDGQPLACARSDGMVAADLPIGARQVVVLSRSFVPEQLGLAEDGRRLGIGVAALWLDGRALALDDPRLVAGWHAAEPGLRWSDGAATLDVAGARSLRVGLVEAGACYWSWAADERQGGAQVSTGR